MRRCFIEACIDVSYLCKGVKRDDDLPSIFDDGLNPIADEARHEKKRRVMARGIIVKTIACNEYGACYYCCCNKFCSSIFSLSL